MKSDEILVAVEHILPCENYTFRTDITLVNHQEYWRESRNAYIEDLVRLITDGIISNSRRVEIIQKQIELYRFWFQVKRIPPDANAALLERREFFTNHLSQLGYLDGQGNPKI